MCEGVLVTCVKGFMCDAVWISGQVLTGSGRTLTRQFEFAAAGVAVVFSSEVPDGVVAQVGRPKDHVAGAAVTQRLLEAT